MRYFAVFCEDANYWNCSQWWGDGFCDTGFTMTDNGQSPNWVVPNLIMMDMIVNLENWVVPQAVLQMIHHNLQQIILQTLLLHLLQMLHLHLQLRHHQNTQQWNQHTLRLRYCCKLFVTFYILLCRFATVYKSTTVMLTSVVDTERWTHNIMNIISGCRWTNNPKFITIVQQVLGL